MNKLFEEIFNEAHLQETSFERLKDDKNLRALFDKYNDEYFNGNLSIDKIGWSSRKTTSRAGACYDDWQHGLKWIEINPLLKNYPNLEAFRDLVVHEMIHIKYMSHGMDFQREMCRINNNYGLNVSITAEGDILKSLDDYEDEKKAERSDKIKNNVNKSDLQEMYDRLNDTYFEGKLDKNVIIEYLPKKTYVTYRLSQVKPDRNSDWVTQYKVSRNDTEKYLLQAMIYAYCAITIKVPKKDLRNKISELEQEIGKKAGYEYNCD